MDRFLPATELGQPVSQSAKASVEIVMEYGHAERNRIAAQRAIAETIELLLRLPSLNEEQVEFMQEFGPQWLRRSRTTCTCGSAPPDQPSGRSRTTTATGARRSA